jgi:hypothetical protein
MGNYLYHFSPRKFESVEKTISIVKSIFENGLFLSEETLNVNWRDVYAIRGQQRELNAKQRRFCLTAITNNVELRDHAERFGLIGFEFEEDFIVKLGGFPVFYVPTPKQENASIEEYKGVSLLYRLADTQEILEYIISHNLIQTKDIDIENVLGAIKFLANVCYPTQRKQEKSYSEQINYYNQREWRLIYGLTSKIVRIGHCHNNYTIESFENKPIRNFMTKILIFEKPGISESTLKSIFEKIEELIAGFGISCKLALVTTD